jgi:hypothetical protein
MARAGSCGGTGRWRSRGDPLVHVRQGGHLGLSREAEQGDSLRLPMRRVREGPSRALSMGNEGNAARLARRAGTRPREGGALTEGTDTYIVPGMKLSIPVLKCERCGYEWIPRREEAPKVCPACKCRTWSTPRKD